MHVLKVFFVSSFSWGMSYGLPRAVGSAAAAGASGTQMVGYLNDPSGRGTPSLVLSCLLTLVLCVWSALHLNVPPLGRTRRQIVWTNIIWITAGIYCPELVVFTAWRQWSSARILSRLVHQKYQSIGEIKEQPLRSPWTMTHSFFASKGGFAFDCSPYIWTRDNPAGFLPANTPARLTITARGMAFLTRCRHLPDVPKGDIDDKSKADALAKTLVILQASWMLLQVLGRLIARLPVTLLEVNTVAHILCAFSMYTMWWNKPLTPKEPIIAASGDWLPDLLAFMYVSSEVSGAVDEKRIKSQTMVKTLFASLHVYSKTPEIEHVCLRSCDVLEELEGSDSRSESSSTRRGGRPTCEGHTRECEEVLQRERLTKELGTAFFERRPRIHAAGAKEFSADTCTQNRRELIANAIQRYEPASEQVLVEHQTSNDVTCVHFKSEQLLTECSRNWPSDELLRDVGGLVVGMVLWLANFLYGGIHAAAWDDHFPSSVEKWLWRSSAGYIGFCGGLWVILNFVVSSYQPLNDFWEHWMDGKKGWAQNITLGSLVFICGFSLMLARAYIVIEAFVSIRELPVAAYETPSWSQVLPHF